MIQAIPAIGILNDVETLIANAILPAEGSSATRHNRTHYNLSSQQNKQQWNSLWENLNPCSHLSHLRFRRPPEMPDETASRNYNADSPILTRITGGMLREQEDRQRGCFCITEQAQVTRSVGTGIRMSRRNRCWTSHIDLFPGTAQVQMVNVGL